MTRILFVDDEPQILQGLKARLHTRRKDWDMQFAGGGAQAIELLRSSHFDVLVTDLRMPGMDGTTLVAHALADSPETIRIVLSGYSDEDQTQRLVSSAHRYLSKPCEPTRLEECIDRCLATRALIQSSELRAKFGSISMLPSIPGTFAALQRALANPDVNARMLARIIERDPATSAKVLQVCNSAFFRLSRRVSSVDQAVSYLGISAVRSITLAIEVFQQVGDLPAGLNLAKVHRHAQWVGAIARSLATGLPWADDAFLAGLLHDIGSLLLGRVYKAEMQQALEAAAAGIALADAERKFIGVDHATAGGYLLTIWGLPFEVVEAVTYHDAAEPLGASHFDILSAVVIAHSLLRELRPTEFPWPDAQQLKVDDAYLHRLGLPVTWASLLASTQGLLNAEEAA